MKYRAVLDDPGNQPNPPLVTHAQFLASVEDWANTVLAKPERSPRAVVKIYVLQELELRTLRRAAPEAEVEAPR